MLRFKKFRNKIFIPFLILNIFFMLIMGLFIHEKMSDLLKQREVKVVQSKLYQASELLDYHLKNALETTSLIYMDKSFQSTLNELALTFNPNDYYHKHRFLLEKTRGLQFSKDVFNIRYFVKGSEKFETGSLVSSSAVLEEKGFYDDLMQSPYSVVWFEDNINPYGVGGESRDVVSAGRLISQQNGIEIFVLVDVLKEDLINVLSKSYLQEEGMLRLKTPNNQIIWETGVENLDKKEGFQEVSLSTSWTIDYYLNSSIFNELKSETRNIFILLLPISIFSLAYVSYQLSRRLTEDLESFATQLKMRGDGAELLSISVERDDEIGEFQRTIKKLLEDIEKINKSYYENKLALKQEQLLRIQSQINPHFLYNIFDFLYWTAMEKEDHSFAEIILNISEFYRNSLYKNDDFVRLEQELNQVKAYVNIQNERYDQKIEMNIQLEHRELLEVEVMNFLLQPVVENALIHGVLENDNEKGFINIDIRRENNQLVIEVSDNGPGFSNAVIEKGFSEGFGLQSIQKRLKLIYGQRASLRYGNRCGAWVKITMPIRKG